MKKRLERDMRIRPNGRLPSYHSLAAFGAVNCGLAEVVVAVLGPPFLLSSGQRR